MTPTLTTLSDGTAAFIDEGGSLNCFYRSALILSTYLKVDFTDKEDDFDAISWRLFYKFTSLTLHYSIYNGVSLFPTNTYAALKEPAKAALQLANAVKNKLAFSEKNK
jgi:hypothetical protein